MPDSDLRIPDFFVVGAAKSGTTSLWNYLGQHPEIFMTADISAKELGYYCNHYGIKNLEEYASYFKDATGSQLVGESCHAYLSSPESAEMIFKANPDARILMVLRNPVDRAYSLYNWMAANGYEPERSFKSALIKEDVRAGSHDFINKNPQGFYMNYYYFRSGLYYEQILRYFNTFGREKCRVIIFEDFRKKTKEYMRDIFSFLSVDSSFVPLLEVHNESQRVWSAGWQYYFRFDLTKRLLKNGYTWQTAAKVSNWFMKLNTRNGRPAPLDEEVRRSLIERYRDDITRTAKLLNVDLGVWLQ